MRKFLTDIQIVGTMLVSRCGKILHYSIPSLLKYCDWILIIMDNENEKTRRIVWEYKEKYPDKIRLAISGFKPATQEQEETPGGLFERFRPLQPYIRDKLFQFLHMEVKHGKKIDLILCPDSDECFNASLPEVLVDFWKSDKKGLYCKHISAYDKLNILVAKRQPGTVIAFKYDPKLSAIPYRNWNICYPLEKDELL